jgi:hypothetical protein
MSIKEKLQNESNSRVHLYKEGAFWVAYEQSAYVVCRARAYKPTKKYVKCVSAEVVSAGFPHSGLLYITDFFGRELQDRLNEPHLKVFALKNDIDTEAFEAWKSQIALTVTAAPEAGIESEITERAEQSEEKQNRAESRAEQQTEMLERIKSFDLGSKTPIECMMFLAEIKSNF